MYFNEEQKALYNTVKEFGENEIRPFAEEWEKELDHYEFSQSSFRKIVEIV